jgi:hypothetical protein
MSINEKDTSVILADVNTLSAILATKVDPTADLIPHSPTGPSDSDSFYSLSYLTGDGYKFTVLLHMIVLNKPCPPGPISMLAISVLDETARVPSYYFSKEFLDPCLVKTEISSAGLGIRMVSDDRTRPLGYLYGTVDQLHIEGHIIDDNQQSIDIMLTLHGLGPTFPYLGSGIIPFPGGLNYEYAFPRMKTSGQLTIQETSYEVNGITWFEREWGHIAACRWTWINIQLTDGVALAIWDEHESATVSGKRVGGRSFGTILDSDGNLTVTTAEIQELTFWESPDGERKYANSWKVTIPGKTELNLRTLVDGQEIVSVIPRIEAKCDVWGSYDGRDATGAAFVEAGDIPPLSTIGPGS